MKYIYSLLVTIVVLSSCKEIDKLTHFNIDYSQNLTVPAFIPTDLPLEVLSPDIVTDSESEFSNNQTHKDLIEQIKLKSFVLDIDSPADQSFSFLKNLEVYLRSEGLEDLKVAWIDNVPKDVGKTIVLTCTEADLQEFVKQSSLKLLIKCTTDELLFQDTEVKGTCNFFVDARILGI